MADFLVTVDGKYIYYGIVRYYGVIEVISDVIDYAQENLGLPGDFDQNDFDVIFNDQTGRVQIFGKYMSIHNVDTKKCIGYIKIDDFWKKAKSEKGSFTINDTSDVIDLRLYRKLDGEIISTVPIIDKVVPKEGDRIILSKRKLFFDQNTYKIQTTIKSFHYPQSSHLHFEKVKDGLDYVVESGVDVSQQIISNNTFLSSLPNFEEQFTTVDISTVAGYHLAIFYSNAINNGVLIPGNENPTPLSSLYSNYIESITLLFHHVFEIQWFTEKLSDYGLEIIFEKFFEVFNVSISNNSQVISSPEYYETFTEEYYSTLYLRLHEFYLWVKRSIGVLVEEEDLLGWILGLFEYNILKYLDYNKKIKILELVLKGNWYISGRLNPFVSDIKLTEEEVIVKIIKSIKFKNSNGLLNYDNINDFMDKLNSIPFYDKENATKTLYEILYTKIDDAIFLGDNGNGAKGQFVKAVYGLWADSKYNPSNDLIPELQRIMPNYTSYNAMWKYDDPNITNKSVDYTAKPLLINYESEKVLLWYNDNFEFPFYENKILATKEVWKNGFESTLQSVINIITPFKDFDYTKYVPFGVYDIFDPIAIRHTSSNDTIIKIPLSVESLQNPCGVTEANNRNEIPIFFLKYVNDLANYSNFKETIGTTVDVVLTFSGVGNITKIKYLTKASVVRRYLSPTLRGGLAVTERQLIERTILQVLSASWQIVLGTAGILHSMTTNSCIDYIDPCAPNAPQPGDENYEQYQDCQAIQGWLLALEIFTLAGDELAKRYFRKKSYELSLRITPDKIDDLPSSFFNDEPITKAQVKSFIHDLGDLDGYLNNFLTNLQNTHPSVWAKVQAFNNQDKKFAFMFDFEGKVDDLAKLELNQGIAVDRWSNLHNLNSIDKSSIEILTDVSLYDGYVKFCARTETCKMLNKIDNYADRVKFIKKYNNPPFNFSPSVMDKINSSPSRFNLMVSHMDNPRRLQSNMFDDANIIEIIESDLLDIHVDILDIKISLSLKAANAKYRKKIKDIVMDINELDNIYKGNIGQFNDLSPQIKNRLKKRNMNKYITETKIYNNGNLVTTINKNFLSGKESVINSVFGGSENVPSWITNPDQSLFDIFSTKAYDLSHPNPIDRNNDTELKYIFDFLANHWNSGDKFVITAKSTLYTCTSCQGYLGYLQLLAEKYGKNITFNVISNPKATSMSEAKNLLQ